MKRFKSLRAYIRPGIVLMALTPFGTILYWIMKAISSGGGGGDFVV